MTWLSRIDKDAKAERDRRIFAAWLACDTIEAIAEREDVDKAQVSRLCCEMADLPKLNKSDQAAAEHATDFYNVWKQQEKSVGSPHYGYPRAPAAARGDESEASQ